MFIIYRKNTHIAYRREKKKLVEIGFLKDEEIHGNIERIRKMLLGLIKHLRGKNG